MACDVSPVAMFSNVKQILLIYQTGFNTIFLKGVGGCMEPLHKGEQATFH